MMKIVISTILLSFILCLCCCEGDIHQDALIVPTVNETKCFGQTICNEVLNYPTKLIEQFLSQNNLTTESLIFTKEDADLPVASRFNVMYEGNPLCHSRKETRKPQAGWDDAGNKWFFLVNHGPYKQEIEVDICEDEDSACSLTDSFPVRTACRQKYIYRKMLAVDNKMKYKMVKLPSCCSCVFY